MDRIGFAGYYGRMDEVSQDAVVRAWLERELAKEDEEVDVAALDDMEALRELKQRKRESSSFIWRDKTDYWYRTELGREEFAALKVIQGSAWTKFSDGTVMGTARRIRDGDVHVLDDKTDIDVRAIVDWADRLPDPDLVGHLILVQPARDGPMVVMDGNHRATAKALYLLRTDDYPGQPAYIATNHPL